MYTSYNVFFNTFAPSKIYLIHHFLSFREKSFHLGLAPSRYHKPRLSVLQTVPNSPTS